MCCWPCRGDVAAIFERGGRQALDRISGINMSIAGAIAEMLTTGRWGFLEHLKGSAEPEAVFRALPGIGPVLAHRIFDALYIGTMEALEVAAYDGRLDRVSGIGRRRLAMVRSALAPMLGCI